MAGIFLDLSGKRFGKWTVAERVFTSRARDSMWRCICDCGAEGVCQGGNLRSGRTSSCADCSRLRPGSYKPLRERDIWRNMLLRCYNPTDISFHNYGGRGIQVCDRWKNSFNAFITDVGRRPGKEFTLDRYPDQNGNYEPGNCRWATRKQQCNNRRGNRIVTYKGTKMTAAEVYDLVVPDISRGALYGRLRRGIDINLALRP